LPASPLACRKWAYGISLSRSGSAHVSAAHGNGNDVRLSRRAAENAQKADQAFICMQAVLVKFEASKSRPKPNSKPEATSLQSDYYYV
jgi:hypothetical protein